MQREFRLIHGGCQLFHPGTVACLVCTELGFLEVGRAVGRFVSLVRKRPPSDGRRRCRCSLPEEKLYKQRSERSAAQNSTQWIERTRMVVPPLIACNNLGEDPHLFVSGFIRGMEEVDGDGVWVDEWMSGSGYIFQLWKR